MANCQSSITENSNRNSSRKTKFLQNFSTQPWNAMHCDLGCAPGSVRGVNGSGRIMRGVGGSL